MSRWKLGSMLNKWVVAYLLIKGVYCIWDYSLLEGFLLCLIESGDIPAILLCSFTRGYTVVFFWGGGGVLDLDG